MSRRWRPWGRGFSTEGDGHQLDERGLPSWLTFTRGAGSWSTQTAAAVDGTTFITTGTAQNTARFNYCPAAGRRMLLIEPTRTNINPYSNWVDTTPANDVPDNWTAGAGVAATDYETATGGPHGGEKFRLLDTAVANRGCSQTATNPGAATSFCESIWSRRTGDGGAGSIYGQYLNPGAATIPLNAGPHDWARIFVVATTVGATSIDYALTSNGDTPGVVELACNQEEVAALYPSTWIPTSGAAASRAAELCAISSSVIGASSGFVSFLWSPLWASTTFATAATLLEFAPGWEIYYDGADDKMKVLVNSGAGAESAALTFSAGDLLRVSLRYNSSGQWLTVDGVTTTDATNWGSPAIAAYLGSQVASAQCESAHYGDLLFAA